MSEEIEKVNVTFRSGKTVTLKGKVGLFDRINEVYMKASNLFVDIDEGIVLPDLEQIDCMVLLKGSLL